MRFLNNILAKAGLIVDGTTQLNTIANATIDTDKFIVSDGGVIKYRTGAEVAADIGAGNIAASTLKHLVKLGASISKGQAVYISSADGTNMIVSKASNASEATSSKTLGILETGGITNDQVYVVTEGLLSGLDTSTATIGDSVWLGTNGDLIFGLANKPYAPAHLVFIGIVTRVNLNNGEIFVKVQNGFELKEIHDVQITTTPSDNSVLSYELSTGLYKMKSIATLLGYTPANNATTLTINGTTYDLSANRTWSVGTVTGTGTTNYVAKFTASGTIGNSQIFDAGASVGINTSTPSIEYVLDVNGQLRAGNIDGRNIVTRNYVTNAGMAAISQSDNTATSYGVLTLRNSANGTLRPASLYVDRTWTLPDKDGTVAMTSDLTGGTVTSVGLSAPTGFSVGNSPVTGSGTIALSFASGYSLPTTASQSNWDTAYNNRITSLTTTGTSGASTLVSNTLNIPQYQAQGSYITSLTGEATASGPGAASVTLTTSAVTGKLLTGLNITGGTVLATDSILTAFGKLQNQVNGLAGGVTYQGTWDSSINSPALTSSVGTKGYYYVVSVAGSTNLNGVTSWNLGDWAIFNGSTWEKVDNTDAVVSVNGFTGAVSLTTTNISEGTNLYYTDTRARAAISLTTTGTSGAATYTSGVLNIPQYSLSGLGGVPTTRQLTINGTAYDLSADRSWSVGTVTSITGGTGLTGGTITSSGTLAFDTTWGDARYQQVLTNPVTGTGTTNYIPKFTSSSAIGNSILYQDGTTTIGIGISTPYTGGKLEVKQASTYDGIYVSSSTSARNTISLYNTGSLSVLESTYLGAGSYTPIGFWTNGSEQMRLTSTGLGIGTSSPAYKLDVAGSGRFGNVSNNTEAITFLDASSTKTHIGSGFGATFIQNNTYYNGSAYVYDDNTLPSSVITLSSGEFNVQTGAANTSPTTKLKLDNAGNLGLGVTPSNAFSGSVSEEIGANGILWTETASSIYNSMNVGLNFYYDASGNVKYKNSIAASRYTQYQGQHQWFTAPSGTAGNAISFTQAMTLDASGNLGVGITSPTSYNSLADNLVVGGSGTNGMTIVSGTSSYGALFFADGTSGADAYRGFIQYNHSGDNFEIGTNGSERMRITSGGDLYVGGTTDAYSEANRRVLSLNGVDNTLISFRASGTALGYIYAYSSALDFSAVNRAMTFSTGSSPTERMRITSGGNVGVGTTSPTFPLEVYNTTDARLASTSTTGLALFYANNTSGRFFFAIDNSAGSGFGNGAYARNIYSDGAYPMVFTTNSSERMRITSGGDVGIGTSSPTFPLTINKTGVLETGNAYGIAQFRDASANKGVDLGYDNTSQTGIILSGTTATASNLAFWTYNGSAWAERMRLDASGNLGLGVTPSAWGGNARVLQGANGSALTFNTAAPETALTSNAYYNGSNWIYSTSSSASRYAVNGYNGSHSWDVAGSGTAGNAISFTQAMTLDASGNLVIGATTNPNSNRLRIVSSGTQTLRVENTATSGTAYAAVLDASGVGATNNRAIYAYASGGTNNVGLYIDAIASGSGNYGIYNDASAQNYIKGNVGIGTTSPDVALHIYKTPSTNDAASYNLVLQDPTAIASRVGSGISFGGFYDATNTTLTFANIKGFKENTTSGDYAGALAFTTRINGGNPTERMRITSGGEILINTTSDAGDYKLQVNGNGYFSNTQVGLVINSTSTGAASYLRVSSSTIPDLWFGRENSSGTTFGLAANSSTIYSEGAYPFNLFVNGSTRLTITSSGNTELSGSIKTAAPSGGTAKPWKLGEAGVSVGGANSTAVRVEIDGTTYYLLTAYLP